MTRATIFAGLLVMPAAVHALATEELGNKPIQNGWGFSSELLTAVNVDERIYWYEVNGNPTFFFKGGSKEVSQAVRQFMRIPAEKREIILVPGAGVRQTFDGKPVAYDWSLHVPMGLAFGGDSDMADNRATLMIHVNALVPAPPKNLEQVKRWIGDLNNSDFKTRELAAKELTAIGRPVAANLRHALKEAKAAETRDRLERILVGMSGAIAVDVLDLPPDAAVVDLEILLERARKELANKSPDVRGYAASSLSRPQVSAEEILPDLEKILTTEKHEYPLRCALGVASRLGAAGKPLLPVIKPLLKSDDKNVVNAAQYAIDAIEKAKPIESSKTDDATRQAIRKEIRQFIHARQPETKRE